jgi:hypothetical protein
VAINLEDTVPLEGLTTDQQATFRTEIGAASAAALSTETATRASADSALQTAINNLSGSTGTPIAWTADNPSGGSNSGDYKAAAHWSFNVDGAVLNTGFPSYGGQTIHMVVQSGDNDVDQVSKSTFIVQNVSMVAYGIGQRVMTGGRLTGWGNGDCIFEDKLLEFGCGVRSDGDEGTKIDRYYLSQSNYVQTLTVGGVFKSPIDTTTTQAILASKDPQTITVANATGVAAGHWIQVDVSAPGPGGVGNQTAFTRQEAVKVIAVNGNNITGIFRHTHPSGALVKGCVVLAFNGGTSFGQGRTLVNLSLPTYTTGQARGNGVNNEASTITGSGTSWSNGMVGGDQFCPGVFSFDVDETPNYYNGLPLRVYYPIWNVSATSLNIYRRNQVGGPNVYQGKARTTANNTFYGYKIFPGAQILETEGNTAIVVLEHNTFNWQIGHTVECAHSQNIDCSLATWRVVCYSPGMDYRSGLALDNHGTQDFATGIHVDGGLFGGEWVTGVSSRGRAHCYVAQLATNETNALFINHSDTQRARIDWANRQYIEFDAINASMRMKVNARGYEGFISYIEGTQASNTWTELHTMKYTGNLMAGTGVNVDGKLIMERNTGEQVIIEPYTNPSTFQTGVRFYRKSGGTKTLIGSIG